MLSKSNKVKASDDIDKWVVGRGNGEKTVHSATSTVIRPCKAYSLYNNTSTNGSFVYDCGTFVSY